MSQTYRMPTTYLQEEWVRAVGGTRSAHGVPLAFEITGRCDVGRIVSAVVALALRHEPLRSAFAITPDAVEHVVSVDARVPVETIRLTELPADAVEHELSRRVAFELDEVFDLTRRLWSARIVTVTETRHVVLLTFHHAIFDGWSNGVIFEDFKRALRGDGALPPPSALQLGDYAGYERTLTLTTEQTRFWDDTLAGAPVALPVEPTVRAPSSVTLVASPIPTLPPRLMDELAELADRCDASVSSALQAAVTASLTRYAGEAIVIGEVLANRLEPERTDIVGLLSDHLPSRVDLSGSPTYVDLIRRAHDAGTAAREHRAPLGVIARGVTDPDVRGRFAAGRPFDVSVNYMPLGRPLRAELELDGEPCALAVLPLSTHGINPVMARGFSGAVPLGYQFRHERDGKLSGELWGHSPAFSMRTLDALTTALVRTLYALVGESERPVRELLRE